jgi:hypothetical protein
MPWSNAVASTNGLKAEPVWRLRIAVLTWDEE